MQPGALGRACMRNVQSFFWNDLTPARMKVTPLTPGEFQNELPAVFQLWEQGPLERLAHQITFARHMRRLTFELSRHQREGARPGLW